MKTTYNLICMTFDGDYVTEKTGFDTVSDAWEHADDMGSRWYFYPFHFVTTGSGITIADTPYGLEWMKNKRLATITEIFEVLSKEEEMLNADVDEFALTLQHMEV